MSKDTHRLGPQGQPGVPVVRIKPHSYQPSKAELEADVSLDATPEELAKAVLRQIVVNEEVKKKPDS